MTTFVRRALTTLRNSKGVTAAEYAILAAGICVVVAGAATTFSGRLTTMFTNALPTAGAPQTPANGT